MFRRLKNLWLWSDKNPFETGIMNQEIEGYSALTKVAPRAAKVIDFNKPENPLEEEVIQV